MSAFRFAHVRAGTERWLKAEWAREASGLRAAFQRPGLVTFKDDGHAPERVPSVFARVQGRALGFAATPEALVARLRERARPTRVHVFARAEDEVGSRGADAGVARDEPGFVVDTRSRIASDLSLDAQVFGRASLGEEVLDVIVAEGEPTFVGVHVHGPGASPDAGGNPRLTLPPFAPSRAYLKLEEALAFSGEAIGAHDVVVELGCAPGGATSALLARGATVVGIDPGDMHPDVLAHPRFTHLAMPVGAVSREALPGRATVIVCDVHLAPPVAIRALRRIVAMYRPSLRLLVTTLKLNDDRMAAEVPRFLAQLDALGPKTRRATQLPANRQEITAILRFEALAV